jgi:acyl-[acyl-carrier-protein]-phospholipid O-acyltransferase/long-chain-fatty-acid--[acyl-carrier-protein] ligase
VPVLRPILKILTRILFRVQLQGYEHYRSAFDQLAGQRVLIIANHTSLLDGLLLALYFEGRLTFAVNTQIANMWWVRFFLSYVDFITLDTGRPFALRGLVHLLRQGKRVVIFPEGRITLTGTLMKVYPGAVLLADHADARILPVSIDGAQYSMLSRLEGSIRRRWFPRIRITVHPIQGLDLDEALHGRARRDVATRKLARIMEQLVYSGRQQWPDLVSALFGARRLAGGTSLALEDMDRQPLTFNQMLEQAILLADHVRQQVPAGKPLALMLPNTTAAVLAVLAAIFARRPILLLDSDWSPERIIAVCELAGVNKIYSAQRYLQTVSWPLSAIQAPLELIPLEQIRDRVMFFGRLWARTRRRLYTLRYRSGMDTQGHGGDIACLLPVESSHGHVDIIAYSHRGLLAKCRQVISRLDIGPHDVVMNAWPLSSPHGLVSGLFLPLLNGAQVMCYPSPYHYRIVPEMAYGVGATVLLANTKTLAGYRQFAHPYDFYATRFAFVAGPVPDGQQASDWLERFGVRLFGSLGSAAAGSVLALNTPLFHRVGSAGRLLPGLKHRLEEQNAAGVGRLWVQGPGLMAGQWRHQQLHKALQPDSDWLDTGLYVRIDDDGYLWPAESP